MILLRYLAIKNRNKSLRRYTYNEQERFAREKGITCGKPRLGMRDLVEAQMRYPLYYFKLRIISVHSRINNCRYKNSRFSSNLGDITHRRKSKMSEFLSEKQDIPTIRYISDTCKDWYIWSRI